MFDWFNRVITSLILLLWSIISLVLRLPATGPYRVNNQQPATRIATPSAQLTASFSAIIPLPATSIQKPVSSTPWGTTEKIGDHIYRAYVGNDPAMGTPGEILAALNAYRKTHGAGELRFDDGLCRLAQLRAQQQDKLGNLDQHQGLIDYMKDDNHWRELNITAIGENASYGYIMSGVHLIEWVFDSDAEHRTNQLNPDWTLACAGVSGVTVDIIFGKR